MPAVVKTSVLAVRSTMSILFLGSTSSIICFAIFFSISDPQMITLILFWVRYYVIFANLSVGHFETSLPAPGKITTKVFSIILYSDSIFLEYILMLCMVLTRGISQVFQPHNQQKIFFLLTWLPLR